MVQAVVYPSGSHVVQALCSGSSSCTGVYAVLQGFMHLFIGSGRFTVILTVVEGLRHWQWFRQFSKAFS